MHLFSSSAAVSCNAAFSGRQSSVLERQSTVVLTVRVPSKRCNLSGRQRLTCKAAITTGEPKVSRDAQNGATPPEPQLPVYGQVPLTATKKPRVVVLGSGWTAASFVKAFSAADAEKFEIVVVSPRNYFLYTPLLPAVATGTCEERSIVEPIRKILNGKGQYFEALCVDIFPEEKNIVACFPKDAGFPEACFKVPYDYLIVGVGSINNTFGIKGVKENAMFFKSIEHANKLRSQVSECFERAALPQVDEEERRRLLSFVIVGGGPTGVEVAAELYDMVHEDLRKLYPQLIKDVKIRVIELQSHLLSTYDRAISNYTKQVFDRNGIVAVLNTHVSSVNPFSVTIVDNATGQAEDLPFGACVWATGVAMNPLVKALQEKLPEQQNFRSLVTDEYLRVLGTNGTIFAAGDAATIAQPKALDFADELFQQYDINGDGRLQLNELRKLMAEASKKFKHLEEHATFLESKYGVAQRFGGVVKKALESARVARVDAPACSLVLKDVDENVAMERDEFAEVLKAIDSGLRALPATAQVARQQGTFLADLMKSNHPALADQQPLPPTATPFSYSHKGSLAYVGSDKAVMDVPRLGPITGTGAGVIWKGFETFSQISFRNQVLVGMDWVRTKLFGRDVSRV